MPLRGVFIAGGDAGGPSKAAPDAEGRAGEFRVSDFPCFPAYTDGAGGEAGGPRARGRVLGFDG